MHDDAFHKPEDDRQYVIINDNGKNMATPGLVFGYREARKNAELLSRSRLGRLLIFELVAAVSTRTERHAEWEYFGDEPQS